MQAMNIYWKGECMNIKFYYEDIKSNTYTHTQVHFAISSFLAWEFDPLSRVAETILVSHLLFWGLPEGH